MPPPITTEVDSLMSIHVDENSVPVDGVLNDRYTSENSVSEKNFKPQFQSKYKGPEFDYTTVKPRQSIWEKLQKRLRKIMETIFGEMDPVKSIQITELVLRILAIFIAGFVLYFLVRFLMGENGNLFFGKKNKKIGIKTSDLHENIHEINFPETIAKFEREKDYRSAIRYQFLFVLKKLTDKKIISWNPEKTNKDYVVELKIENETLNRQFSELVYIFDNVWYGEFEINQDSYQNFKQKFTEIKF